MENLQRATKPTIGGSRRVGCAGGRRWLLWSMMAVVIFPSVVYCASDKTDIRNNVNKFIARVLSKAEKPTLSDYDEFYRHSEVYGDFLLTFCKERGFCPSFRNPECRSYTWDGVLHNKAISLYFDWLRTKLPLSPKEVIIQQVKYIEEGEGVFDYELVSTSINGVSVVFFRPIPHPHGPDRGLIRVFKISGILVSELIKKELSFPNEEPPCLGNK